jgi:anhydro-N-acetylmuramic acid kinase
LLWIGLMSGTSADGVDAALVDLGESPRELELVHFCSSPFSDSLRERIHGALAAPVALRELLALDRELGERFAEAALALLRAAGIAPAAVAGIGSHGQTLAHYPDPDVAGSLQLGSAAEIHALTGIRVISDFRRADLSAGGQGAPLTPFLHHARFATDRERRAVLNIGGFTNVTYLPDASAERVIAFDPGPGNALLDRAARWVSQGRERFDEGGARARRGRVDEALLEELLSDPYFALPPPKSTGHEHFGEACFERARRGIEAAGGGEDDLLTTLVALTVESVARSAERFFPEPAERWLACGGGVHNAALLERLAARLAPAALETTDAHGLPGDALEAVAFAVLGWASSRGLPGNLPAATGAARRVVLGSATPPG